MVPWTGTQLAPVFAELVPVVEKIMVGQVKGKATAANLPATEVKAICQEAEWNDVTRKALELSAPAVAAKWLNKSGVSAEHQDEVVLVTALAGVAVGHFRLCARLDELIALQKQPTTTQPRVPQPPPAATPPAPKP